MASQSQLDGIYKFMKHATHGNWQMRWESTPFMAEFLSQGKSESILAHMWGCMAFWYQIKRVSPALNEVVNTELLYDIILHHDLGETYQGDISMTRQINGEGANKKFSEREELLNFTSTLRNDMQEEIIKNFDLFEVEIENTNNIEVAVAKFIDSLQANQFALNFGNNLKENSELINKIIQKRFVPYAIKLIDLLSNNGKDDAANEVRDIANHQLEQMKLAGIEVTSISF